MDYFVGIDEMVGMRNEKEKTILKIFITGDTMVDHLKLFLLGIENMSLSKSDYANFQNKGIVNLAIQNGYFTALNFSQSYQDGKISFGQVSMAGMELIK